MNAHSEKFQIDVTTNYLTDGIKPKYLWKKPT